MVEREHVSEMRALLFGEGLMIPTLKEDKQISLRKFREGAHDFKKGEYFIGRFKDGLDILLQSTTDTEVKTFYDLTTREAQEDGFTDADDAFEKMHKYYPDLQKYDKLALVRYEVAKINGTPSVKANEDFKG